MYIWRVELCALSLRNWIIFVFKLGLYAPLDIKLPLAIYRTAKDQQNWPMVMLLDALMLMTYSLKDDNESQ